MAERWRSRTFLVLGVLVLLGALAVFVWELFQGPDVELIDAPLLLVGIFLLFEGYLARRRERRRTDNPK